MGAQRVGMLIPMTYVKDWNYSGIKCISILKSGDYNIENMYALKTGVCD